MWELSIKTSKTERASRPGRTALSTKGPSRMEIRRERAKLDSPTALLMKATSRRICLTYEGLWREGLMEGLGFYSWPAGQCSSYEGLFKKGLKEGQGVLLLRDGRKYEGHFSSNKLHGEVTEVMPSGKSRKGIWKEGVFQQWAEAGEKVLLNVAEKDTDKDEEYGTSIFSNPDAYTQVYKTQDRKRMKIKGGVLRGKIKEDTSAQNSRTPSENLQDEQQQQQQQQHE
ncbi:IQ calmodulin-binding motif family protein, related [Eimeria necatrix]|uniref:IQ calmodulin-binding motif family protein, related n=1 Tax=Eimeria necatrix TaxID=51315 RepID=U6MN48_9EIME|nr:IQ calmodulin-binding motif family protein, related [Eimeria necatrix]CDJ65627.1 IQ calmodulin-binding motif family protein, related [Eimeria necatrix]